MQYLYQFSKGNFQYFLSYHCSHTGGFSVNHKEFGKKSFTPTFCDKLLQRNIATQQVLRAVGISEQQRYVSRKTMR